MGAKPPTVIDPASFAALASVPLPSDWDETLAPALTDIRELAIASITDVFLHGSPDQVRDLTAKIAPILFRKQSDDNAAAVLEQHRLELRTMLERAGASFFPGWDETAHATDDPYEPEE